MVTLEFFNKNAARKVVMIRCDVPSLDNICEWYASHHAGDKYDVYVNGYKRLLDDYGLIVGIDKDAS